ncbi:MAG: hypothetical protein IJS94_01150 [Clostridia bacterium]|nr:hypothetical protein [Clostridia bacterium]
MSAEIDYTCPNCGAEMYETDAFDYQLECPVCGAKCTVDDGVDEGPAVVEEYYDSNSTEELPEYCKICGGPYPDCTSSCKLFDN